MRHYNVPFVENPDDKCVPAVIGMVLQYFMPEKSFTMEDFIKFTGYRPGKGTWSAESMLNLLLLGFETEWIEDFDNQAFIKNPEGYLAIILDDEAFRWQVANSNLKLEAERIQKYISTGHQIKHRKGTKEDIKKLLDNGWLVRVEVNARPLADKEGYEGHSVLVTGYNDKNVEIHNPDGVDGNIPNQIVTWSKFEQSWKEFGGSYSLYAFRYTDKPRSIEAIK